MSDNEAREETPPEYDEEDIGEDWIIYLQLKGIILEPKNIDDENFYTVKNFTKILQLEKGLTRKVPLLHLLGNEEISNISYEEYRIVKRQMKDAHPFPFVQGVMPSPLQDIAQEWDQKKFNMMDCFEPILIITFYKPTIFK